MSWRFRQVIVQVQVIAMTHQCALRNHASSLSDVQSPAAGSGTDVV
jgi:hypothetical protein